MATQIPMHHRNAEGAIDRLLGEEQSGRGDGFARTGEYTPVAKGEGMPAPVTTQAEAVKKWHPAPVIAVWITLSSSVILMNAWILGNKEGQLGFRYPIFLTTTHLIYASIATRLLRRFTHLLDGLGNVQMSWDRWYKNIVPIGALFSASLIFSNIAYLTLSVSFIQMLKAFTSVAVLGMSVMMGLDSWDQRKAITVIGISAGVALASYGELRFVFSGFVAQCLGILFEATRLVAIQRLLNGLKMDPMVSLYYYAPVCAVFNGMLVIAFEGWAPLSEILDRVGPVTLFVNCNVALLLNVSVVFLIGCASSLVLTLSGVLKDILLVAGSVILFGSPVSFIQLVGYAIALLGLFIFKTPKDKTEEYIKSIKSMLGR